MNHENEIRSVSQIDKRSYAIKVLGVGGAGGNAVSHLVQESLAGVECVALNTDLSALAHCGVPTKLILGSKSSRGLGAGGDPERGRRAAEEDLETVYSLCQGADVVFVVAGLGGGTGTGAGPVIARAAKEKGALVLSIVMLPFDCEGARRQSQARQGLQALKQASDGVICLPNQKVFKLIDENTSLLEAFRITNEIVAQGVQGIWRLLSKPGLINVDFADLCSVTQGRHATGALVTVEGCGEHRVRDLLHALQQHPLFEAGQTLTHASGILACIAGGPELSMKEVERVMEQIRRQGEQAHIIMGAAIDSDLSNRISLTLIAAGDSAEVLLPEDPELRSLHTNIPPSAQGHALPDQEELPPSMDARTSRAETPQPPSLGNALDSRPEPGTPHAGRRKGANRPHQTQLPLEIISKGRFEKSEPTLHHGQDLDVPTYIRRGVPLN